MSEKTLMELVETRLEIDAWRAYRHEQQPWIAMFDARIRRAEAAEQAIEAWLAWCDSGNANGTWDAFAKAVAEYKSAREAVRKMEDGT
jgi:hypothetical protein